MKAGRGLQKSSATVSDLCLLRIFLGASLSSGTQLRVLLGECDSLLYLRQESGYPECLGVLAGLGEVARRKREGRKLVSVGVSPGAGGWGGRLELWTLAFHPWSGCGGT